MDPSLIGRFIASLRKDRGWTQTQLAEQLGVTDKAVSRWETGHGLPDVSLLKPLSDVLEVTINELLSGRTLDLANQPARADDIILETMQRANRRVDRAINLSILVLGAVLVIWCLLFLGYDTSWVSLVSWPGVILIATAVFRMARQTPLRAILIALAVLVAVFGLFEASDYHRVTNLSLPPLFIRGTIITTYYTNKVIEYHKPFYTVYRYNPDTPEEHFEIK